MKIKNEITEKSDLSAQLKSQVYTDSLPEGEIREIIISTGEEFGFTSRSNKVVFITCGKVECCMEGYPCDLIYGHSFFFVRVGIQCCIKAQKDSRIILMRPGNTTIQQDSTTQAYISGVMANKVSNDTLMQQKKHLPALSFNTYIRHFALGLLSGLSYSVKDEFYTSIKIKEFFFLVGISYSENDRIRFFESLNTAEQSFAAFIYYNYKRASSVRELADMACYSLSGFEKRFRKIFGQPASLWIARRKAQMIYTEICDTSKPFKQLSHEYGFSYPSHFTRFCHKYLGYPPGVIREKHSLKDGK